MHAIYGTNFDKQTEIDFQMSANEPYPVKPAIIVGIFVQTGRLRRHLQNMLLLLSDSRNRI